MQLRIIYSEDGEKSVERREENERVGNAKCFEQHVAPNCKHHYCMWVYVHLAFFFFGITLTGKPNRIPITVFN